MNNEKNQAKKLSTLYCKHCKTKVSIYDFVCSKCGELIDTEDTELKLSDINLTSEKYTLLPECTAPEQKTPYKIGNLKGVTFKKENKILKEKREQKK